MSVRHHRTEASRLHFIRAYKLALAKAGVR